MEKTAIFEQDIVNAVCIYVADKYYVQPEEVSVELIFDDESGFSAEIEINDRLQKLTELNLIEALRHWLDSEHGLDPMAVGLELELDEQEGIIAYVS
ncbi:YxcD family protein [Heyndrickxia sp. NPDC080065]|uniref:YxcD family protein n=1 Tax=Heyndrickxia sp. NPDC080065 TaxID=3390568 RepID=UPI003D083639